MDILTRSALDATGWTAREIKHALRQQALTRLRRGYYSQLDDPTRPTMIAAGDACSDAAVISHSSAAWLHHLPVRRESLSHVHLTRSRRGGGRIDPGVHVYACPVRDDEIMEIDGLRVTTPARTVVDVARHEPPPWAVAVGDAALSQGTTREELAEQLARAARRPRVRRARRILPLLDGTAESPGESISRWALYEAGLASPELQVEIPTRLGVFRVDFLWEKYGLIGEFDGLVKYGVEGVGADVTAALVAEKRREDALRAEGFLVVRWTWEDLWTPGRVSAMVRDGMEIARRSRTRRSA